MKHHLGILVAQARSKTRETKRSTGSRNAYKLEDGDESGVWWNIGTAQPKMLFQEIPHGNYLSRPGSRATRPYSHRLRGGQRVKTWRRCVSLAVRRHRRPQCASPTLLDARRMARRASNIRPGHRELFVRRTIDSRVIQIRHSRLGSRKMRCVEYHAS